MSVHITDEPSDAFDSVGVAVTDADVDACDYAFEHFVIVFNFL